MFFRKLDSKIVFLICLFASSGCGPSRDGQGGKVLSPSEQDQRAVSGFNGLDGTTNEAYVVDENRRSIHQLSLAPLTVSTSIRLEKNRPVDEIRVLYGGTILVVRQEKTLTFYRQGSEIARWLIPLAGGLSALLTDNHTLIAASDSFGGLALAAVGEMGEIRGEFTGGTVSTDEGLENSYQKGVFLGGGQLAFAGTGGVVLLDAAKTIAEQEVRRKTIAIEDHLDPKVLLKGAPLLRSGESIGEHPSKASTLLLVSEEKRLILVDVDKGIVLDQKDISGQSTLTRNGGSQPHMILSPSKATAARAVKLGRQGYEIMYIDKDLLLKMRPFFPVTGPAGRMPQMSQFDPVSDEIWFAAASGHTQSVSRLRVRDSYFIADREYGLADGEGIHLTPKGVLHVTKSELGQMFLDSLGPANERQEVHGYNRRQLFE